jgi:pimeloyl-ACP methyl ester carboxylesterase
VSIPEEQIVDDALERVEIAPVGGGVEIAYESFGDPSDPPVLLVMGLGMQMLGWDEEFCETLAARDLRVIRFDNRDVGLSTKSSGQPNVIAAAMGRTGSASYTIPDMAADATGLLDHLGIESAHVVGASMGGMIAQTLAFRHPERVASLTSIMSGPGGRDPRFIPRLSVIGMLLAKPPTEREAYAEHVARMFERIGSTGFQHDPVALRRRALIGYDRCFYPIGTARQLVAIMASGSRGKDLPSITAPTTVIHGLADKLMPSAAGRAVAKAIPGARLELFEGMGHDLPRELWPAISDLIAETASREPVPARA